jgi:hypothetical protein
MADSPVGRAKAPRPRDVEGADSAFVHAVRPRRHHAITPADRVGKGGRTAEREPQRPDRLCPPYAAGGQGAVTVP